MRHPTDTSAAVLDAAAHPALQPGDLATLQTVRAGVLKVTVLSGNGERYGASHPASSGQEQRGPGGCALVRVTSQRNTFYRAGERMSVSPLWLTLRRRVGGSKMSREEASNALRAEAAAALVIQAEETLTVPVPLRLAMAQAPEPAGALAEALGTFGKELHSRHHTRCSPGSHPELLTPAQRAGALKQAQYCGRVARGHLAWGRNLGRETSTEAVYQWARDAAHYAGMVAD